MTLFDLNTFYACFEVVGENFKSLNTTSTMTNCTWRKQGSVCVLHSIANSPHCYRKSSSSLQLGLSCVGASLLSKATVALRIRMPYRVIWCAEYITWTLLPNLQNMHIRCCGSRTGQIMKEIYHPSSCWSGCPMEKTQHFQGQDWKI